MVCKRASRPPASRRRPPGAFELLQQPRAAFAALVGRNDDAFDATVSVLRRRRLAASVAQLAGELPQLSSVGPVLVSPGHGESLLFLVRMRRTLLTRLDLTFHDLALEHVVDRSINLAASSLRHLKLRALSTFRCRGIAIAAVSSRRSTCTGPRFRNGAA